MIHPMKRYGFLVYHGDLNEFLEQLRDLGLVDITAKDWEATDAERELLARSTKYRDVAKQMKSIKLEPEEKPFDTVKEAVAKFEKADEVIAAAETSIHKAENEAKELKVWGDFDPAMLMQLKEEGIDLRFFETSAKQYKSEWEQDYPIDIVAHNGSNVYFVVAQPTADNEPINLPNTIERRAPQVSVSQKEAEIERLLSDQIQWQKVRARAALSREAIEKAYQKVKEEFEFSQAMNSGEVYADGTVKILEGWSLIEDESKIVDFAESQDAIYTVEDARAEQNPPIKLKNGFFARLFEPIGSLYMLPRYNELDMTPFFAPFFMLFFGMCFADAGYGLLFILLLLLFWKKIPVRFRPFGWLVFFLSLAAVIFGIFTGNVFGIQLVDIPMFEPFRKYFLDPNKIFYLSIAIGALQVIFGQILRIFNRIKRGGSILYGLSTIGWVILMIGSVVAFTRLLSAYTTSSVAYYITLGIAGVLIFFFNSPGKNPFVNFGSGLYDTYSMATGVVGDLISYVRLFAIGLVGGVIGQVFNELAFGLGGDMPIIAKQLTIVVILLFGHGLNIFIGLLGSFVHPVRLTFVEFYKNSEFEGGSREFEPFRKIGEPEELSAK